jgi:hypothetical protein
LKLGGAPFVVKSADFDLRFKALSFSGAPLFPVLGKGGSLD